MRRVFLIVGSVVAVGIFVICAFVAYVIHCSSAPQTDVAGYETAIGPYRSEYGAHFPAGIPVNARAVRFYYLPGFLQGGTEIQLGFVLPKDEVTVIRQKIEAKAIDRWMARRLVDQPDGRLMTPGDGGSAKSNVKDEYEVYVLKSTPDENWNHPKMAGVAISEKYSEVIYWLEDD